MNQSRRGGVVVIVALVVAVLAGFIALVLDLGYARLVSEQLRMSTDAAALAAVKTLENDGTVDDARNDAVLMAANNSVAGSPLTISTTDVELGTWDDTIGWTTETDPDLINAVRITSTAEAPYLISAIPRAFYAGGSGDDAVALERSSLVTATPGDDAGAVTCFLPIALPKCYIDNLGQSAVQSVMFDATRSASASTGAPSQMWIATPGTVFNATRVGLLALNCKSYGEIAIGDNMSVSQGATGSSFTTPFTRIVTGMSSSTTTWDTSVWGTMPAALTGSAVTTAGIYGHTLEGPVPVINAPSLCGSPTTATGFYPIVGFVWGSIYDVVKPTSTTYGRLRLRFDTTGTHAEGSDGGGPGYNVVITSPQVRFIEDEDLATGS